MIKAMIFEFPLKYRCKHKECLGDPVNEVIKREMAMKKCCDVVDLTWPEQGNRYDG